MDGVMCGASGGYTGNYSTHICEHCFRLAENVVMRTCARDRLPIMCSVCVNVCVVCVNGAPRTFRWVLRMQKQNHHNLRVLQQLG